VLVVVVLLSAVGISLFSYGGRSYAYTSDVGLDVGLV
jgi:hypothetical protein